MMNYHENETLIHAYLDNELDTTSSLVLLEHAKECASCRGKLEGYSALKKNLRQSLPHYSTPFDLRRTILNGVKPKTRFPWPRIVRRSVPLAAALSLGLWIGVIITTPKDDTNDIVWDHIHALKSGHLMDVASSDKHTVKPWFAGRTDFSPLVIDLASSGFPLLGARAENLDGHDVATLVYSTGKHYLELYEWPLSDKIGASTGTFRGFNTNSFQTNEMRCYLVSDASNEELNKFEGDLLITLKPQ